MRANHGVWGAESAIHLLLRLKPHSVHSLPGNWNTLSQSACGIFDLYGFHGTRPVNACTSIDCWGGGQALYS